MAAFVRPIGRFLLEHGPWVLPAWVFWELANPGLLSPDSLDQFEQAATGKFDTTHPVLMSVCLRFFMHFGGTLPLMVLLQAALAFLGLRAFARALAARLGLSSRRTAAASCLVLLLLGCSPLSAFPFWAVTWWKDVWTLIAMLWVGALFLSQSFRPLPFAVAATVTCLARHNGILVLPLLALLALYRSRRWWPPVLVVVLCIGTRVGLAAYAQPRQAHGERYCMIVDLAMLSVRNPAVREEAPFFSSHFNAPPGTKLVYDFGEICGPYCPDWKVLMASEETTREYWRVFKAHPLAMLWVKAVGYAHTMFGVVGLSYWRWPPIDVITQIQRPPELEPARTAAFALWLKTLTSPVFRHLFSIHLHWMIFGLAAFLVFVRRRTWDLALLVSFPLAWYAAYLPSLPSVTFRYGYTSDVLLQVMAVVALVGWRKVASTVFRPAPTDGRG